MNGPRMYGAARRVHRIHCIGIGGAGMSGIAEVLLGLGYRVSGSDLRDNEQTRRLRSQGADIRQGHAAEAIAGADVVVISSAVPQDNPERVAAQEAGIPVIPRAEMLAELMRLSYGIAVAGAHGKTTVTSMIVHLMCKADLDPTWIIGGRIRHHPSHAALGGSDYLICEADESDGSFLHLNPMIAVVANIDNDHLVNYGGDMQVLEEAYHRFLGNLPFYGLAVLCVDDPRTAALAGRIDRKVLTCATDAPADIVATDLHVRDGGYAFTVHCADTGEQFETWLRMPGRHNVQNALAALAVARDLGVSPAVLAEGLADFTGISRRFEDHGEHAGFPGVHWIDDYGHHPQEIRATLATVRELHPGRRIVLAFQPHRYTRVRDLFDDMVSSLAQAEELVLLDVYAASEDPIAGADSDALAQALRSIDAHLVRTDGAAGLAAALGALLRPGDVLLTMGAGSIDRWAASLDTTCQQTEATG